MRILRAPRVITGDGEVLESIDVGIEGDRILELGRNLKGDSVLELPGMTLLPGLIDSHVHLCLSGDVDPQARPNRAVPYAAIHAAENALKSLRAGFTTLRDLGSPNGIAIAVREAIQDGIIEGPRLFVSGRPISITGGHGIGAGAREADGSVECARATREQIKAGADVIKAIATGGVLTQSTDPSAYQLDLDELKAIVREAHKAGKTAAAHAHGTDGIKNAIKAGIDSIEHGTYSDEEALTMMIENNVSLVICIRATREPTLPGARELGVPSWVAEKDGEVLEHQLMTFRRAHELGVHIVMGTDAGTPLNHHGDNARELNIFVANGMSEMAAISSATREGARLLRAEENIGTIESGRLADLIAVEGNPLDDISRLETVMFVMKGGKVIVDAEHR